MKPNVILNFFNTSYHERLVTTMNLQEKLKLGGTALGTMLSELYTPNAARIFSAAGLDCFLVDCEHGAFDWSSLASMAACAKAADFPMIVRVPKIDREWVLKSLELGAVGILAPMVQDAAQAAELVGWAKYAPLGVRGISTRRSHNNYNASDICSYLTHANEETMVFAQIETREALGNLAEIAAVKGLAGLIIGPSDLSSDLGDFNNFNTDEIRAAIQAVVIQARENGICSGIISSSLSLLKCCRNEGMQFLSWSSELSMIYGAIQKTVSEISDTVRLERKEK